MGNTDVKSFVQCGSEETLDRNGDLAKAQHFQAPPGPFHRVRLYRELNYKPVCLLTEKYT